MRTMFTVIAWIGIFYALICVFAILTEGVSSLEFVQVIANPWLENISPLIADLADDWFGTSIRKNMSIWVAAAFPFVAGILILMWSQSNKPNTSSRRK